MNLSIPAVCNIVTLWDLKKSIEILGKSSKKKKFNADVLKFDKKRLLVFGSGKIIATGFKSQLETENFVTGIYPEIEFKRVINITASKKISPPLKVAQIFKSDLIVTYEPELFPALNWKENGVCFIYYPKGSLILTGAKSIDQLEESYSKFCHRFNLPTNTL
ncbi:uncharacterized protein LOC128397435 [Panonychus citri]|uniref:uncharacterized protein LOC128397435 n=1 Tax=Panonychus citri TaxID=50023 RepID=UPI0023074321|nr:uncharacterized protein LOC128397435 [Panonychus citri]